MKYMMLLGCGVFTFCAYAVEVKRSTQVMQLLQKYRSDVVADNSQPVNWLTTLKLTDLHDVTITPLVSALKPETTILHFRFSSDPNQPLSDLRAHLLEYAKKDRKKTSKRAAIAEFIAKCCCFPTSNNSLSPQSSLETVRAIEDVILTSHEQIFGSDTERFVYELSLDLSVTIPQTTQHAPGKYAQLDDGNSDFQERDDSDDESQEFKDRARMVNLTGSGTDRKIETTTPPSSLKSTSNVRASSLDEAREYGFDVLDDQEDVFKSQAAC